MLKTSGPNCILVVVLKTCKHELSGILADVFSMYPNESYFSDGRSVWSVVLLSENVGDRSMVKNYRLVSLLFLVSNILWKTCKRYHQIACWSSSVTFFNVFSMVSDLLGHFQIFRQLHMIELLELLRSLGLIID